MMDANHQSPIKPPIGLREFSVTEEEANCPVNRSNSVITLRYLFICYLSNKPGNCNLRVVSDTANPNPSIALPVSDQSIFSVLIPITFPSSVRSGPQLFPGLIGASICISQRSFCPS